MDVFLICHTEALWQRAHAALVQLGERESWARAAIHAAAARVRRLKARYLPQGLYTPGDLSAELDTDAHRAVVKRVRSAG